MGTPADMPERPFSPTFDSARHNGLDLSDDEIVEVGVLSKDTGQAEEEGSIVVNGTYKDDYPREASKEKNQEGTKVSSKGC